jgi:hypothetical protein
VIAPPLLLHCHFRTLQIVRDCEQVHPKPRAPIRKFGHQEAVSAGVPYRDTQDKDRNGPALINMANCCRRGGVNTNGSAMSTVGSVPSSIRCSGITLSFTDTAVAVSIFDVTE